MAEHVVRIDVDYLGDLHTEVKHAPSGQSFLTDAPVDNEGKGEYISPTDLAGASIASCVATIMAIKARKNDINIEGLHISVEKRMVNVPFRRIGKLSFEITFRNPLSKKEFDLMANVVKTCPVTRSLHPDIELDYKFNLPE